MNTKNTKETQNNRYEDLAIHDPYAYVLLHRAFEFEGLNVKKGDTVVPTEWAKQNTVCKNITEGTVKGFGTKGFTIRVLPKGKKTVNTYWAGFWRKKNHPYLEMFLP